MTNEVMSEADKSGLGQQWQVVCSRQDLVAGSGVVAWVDGRQVAIFYLPGEGPEVYGLDNRDPRSGANVIGHGILGCLDGQLVVAAPLYKQHFRLTDGQCLEDPQQKLHAWPLRLNGDRVEVAG